MQPPSVREMETYIRQAATARGIDPDVAVRVARSEGLAPNTWQSNYRRSGYREPSYGPFQLLMGGAGTGFPRGMGNDFQRVTGLDPSDPANAYASIDYALDRAATDGWGAWYGAPKVGVGRREGLENARAIGVTGQPGISSELASFMEQPSRVMPMPVNTDPAALGNMNVTAAPTPPMRRDNPANPTFADNAVGPLVNRQTGPTPRTVQQMLSGAPQGSLLPGGPAERALNPRTASATGTARAGVAPALNVSGSMNVPAQANQPSSYASSRVANAFDDLDRTQAGVAASNIPESARYSTRGNVPSRLSRNPFDTMRGQVPGRITPSERVERTFADLGGTPSEATSDAPQEPLEVPQTVSLPPIVADPRVSLPSTPPAPQARPYSAPRVGPMARAGQVAGAILPQSMPARAGTLIGGLMGGPLGMVAGRVAGGGVNTLLQNRPQMTAPGFGARSYSNTPQGQAVQAATRGGGFDNQAYTRTYAQAGGSDDPRSYSRALAEEQRQRSMAGQPTVGDAIGGLFGGWK